jgi:hypothetical protein
MKRAKIDSPILFTILLSLGAFVGGCTPGSNSANDVADEIGKALDQDPNYVDEPAPGPQKPQ